MPDASTISPYVVRLGGGLVLDRDTFSIPPGAATQLQNFEPDISGGYRRINGFSKYNSNIIPQTSSATEKILGVVLYKDQVIAARGEKVYKGTTSGSWTEIDSGRTNAGRFDFAVFNHDGTDKVVWCDGQNAASVYNNTTVTDITTSPAPSNPSNCVVFKGHLFLSGASANPSEIFFSAPFAETDFTPASGGGSFRTESAVLKLKVFRDRLFIFCKEEIYQLVGNSVSDFKLQPVTKDIGCLSGFSVQEIGGDLVYLAPDGLRTIAGTERIDDIELGTVSKQVQPRLDNASLDRISSLVIRNKSQYRLFFPEDSQTVSNAAGLIGVIKANPEGQVGWEYADLKGLKPACCASGFVSNVETQVHGGYDGYVYRHDNGNNFDGTNIKAIYLSPDHTMGDPGIRKMMQRIIWSYDNEAAVNTSFRIRYDFGASDVPQPAQYALTTGSSIAIYSNTASTYGTAVYGSSGSPLVRQTVEGGGFTIAVRFDDNNGAAPISLKGYQLEFTPGGRR